ncbi:MAG: cysteine desulfurase [Clostridia bacterium]|nr:cysteine desulfurase [Clostridia bacterium]
MPSLSIYLDHAATTFPDEAVIRAMAACMRETPFNASAAYGAAGDARRIHRLARGRIAAMLSCPPEDLYFTSGGTEANNWAVRAFSGQHAVVSAIEHHSILEAARMSGCRFAMAYPDSTGYVTPESIAAAITPDTKLVCLQAANNETGVIQPVRAVYALCKARNIRLHVDAVQAFGHIPVSAEYCDSMSLSAHKLYGPRGVGALYIRSGAALPPLLVGGGQESGMRAGTENTPAICGFDVAARIAGEDMQLRMHRERELLNRFVSRLIDAVPEIVCLGEGRARLPGVAALLLPGLSAEAAISAMDLRGVMLSGGAACASHSGMPSHVYTAMGLSPQEAARVIRVSIGRRTTAGEMDYAANELIALIRRQAR